VVGKPEGTTQLGELRRRWENNINTVLGKLGLEMWIGFSWQRIGAIGG
jgi:hypothetical protein